ncbi:uroporphyrinogen-III C-methyltransferase [Brucella abortus 99-9971-135]|nr:Siroheme synthase / Precorrin-2 oxidase [Brucella abortus]ENP45669.1 uroporphyrinogen-III C-methyltransferase [Brucella abortus 80/102]ENQ11388.1 uroporphyrinogen-III C-methyltransferase [Brucella abortus LEVI237]ENR53255.1 uroporphyrinogen-III C-methyltransferase [Brucella abortus 63/130]ENR78715.1 uroporphyrinogen-III C-methyltransferase [Brucella abortus 65/157]ENR81464.1 uroporphyrinogen-III C-methyltransferase [Brucella abortus 67/93]ENS24999.1 uroporphyrinogen-III C-methyltransferase
MLEVFERMMPVSLSQTRLLADFPAFFRVSGEVVAVVGGGEEALNKARLVAQTAARLRIIAEKAEPHLAAFIESHGVEHIASPFAPELLDGAKLVFVATGDEAGDRAAAAAARARKIPVNVVDRPALCDFLTPAIVNRAPVTIAIGSQGTAPVLAQMVRARIDAAFSPRLGELAHFAESWRPLVERALPKGLARRGFWRTFFSGKVARAVESGDHEAAHRAAAELIGQGQDASGHVWLVGAGPGAEDLLTLRAQRVLIEADVIVHDALVPEGVIAMGRRDAERLPVGKRKGCHSKSQGEINRLLVKLGQEGKRVVRLKSGDPLVFGRAGEEMAALRAAGIGFEVVPGITSAFAAAADMELPLTLRGVASSLVFTTGHDMTGDVLPGWAKLAVSGATIAVYMGSTVAASVASRLIAAGLHEDTAVAVVENASRSNKRMFHGTLKDLPQLENRKELSGPVMVVIGDAVAGAAIGRAQALSLKPVPVAA